jgi:hypothetical protein
MNYYELREGNKCVEDMSRNLVLGKGNQSYNGQTSDKLMKKYVSKQTNRLPQNCTCDKKTLI